MEKDIAISVKDVKKRFKVYYDKGNSLKEKLLFWDRNRYEERWVLKGISFQVKKGEAVGIIGRNGCGKSTTLKMLTKIMYPTSGLIEVQGRVSSMIELGAGFHPDLSGRENIYTNASIFGLTRKEIDTRIDEIITFSELEEYIDNPVRTYSSGMYMRLAFSVAINVNADVLLIDEILAVGDVSFQYKCFEKLKEIKANGTTIIIVSHSLGQIEQICDQAIWIEDGMIKDKGKPKFVTEKYLASMENERLNKYEQEQHSTGESQETQEQQDDSQQEEHKEKEECVIVDKLPSFCCKDAIRSGNKKIEITNVRLMNVQEKDAVVFQTSEDIIIEIEYKAVEAGLEGNFGIGFVRADGVYCYGTNTLIALGEMIKVNNTGKVQMKLTKNKLLPARYILDVAIHTEDERPYDKIHHIMEFQIKSDHIKDFGVSRLENVWTIQ